MRILVVILAAAGIIGLGTLGYEAWFSFTHHCVRSHQVFRPAHTDSMLIGDVPIDYYYPDSYDTVCDVWEENP